MMIVMLSGFVGRYLYVRIPRTIRGVELSRKASGGRAKVFASMGPSGVMLMMGETTPEELEAAFFDQASAMAAAGADGIVIETMSDPEETKLAVAAAKRTGLPVVACMVFDSGKNLDRTMMGTTPEQAAAEREQNERLMQAVRGLTPDEQVLISLRYFMELAESEVAQTLNIPPGTVKSRLHRTLTRLREIIARDYPDLRDSIAHD